MKKLSLALFLGAALCQFRCSEDSSEPTLTVTAINPTSGKVNTTVEVTGTGFDPNPSQNMVSFNGKTAVITSGTKTSLFVQVPSKAGTGQVVVSARDQTVTGPEFEYVLTATVSTLAGSTSGYLDGVGTNAKFRWITNLFIDNAGNIYVPDRGDHRIRKVAPNGEVTTIAGTGVAGHKDGLASQAQFYSPAGLAIDNAENMFVTDLTYNFIRKITPSGTVSTFAGSGFNSWVDGVGVQAGFNNPISVDIDPAGNLYVLDQQNNAVRKITPDATVTTFSGRPHDLNPRFMDGAGTVARFFLPQSIERDLNGHFIVADRENNRIRKIAPDGSVTTLAGNGEYGFIDGPASAARFALPAGIGIDPNNGNVYVADERNHCIRVISPNGMVTTLAGNGTSGDANGDGADARFYYPMDVVVNSSGEIFVSDYFNLKIKKIVIE